MPEAFPSLRTVQKEASGKYCSMVEGEFRFDILSDHLDAYNAPKVISVSEDATRVLSMTKRVINSLDLSYQWMINIFQSRTRSVVVSRLKILREYFPPHLMHIHI